MKRWISVAFLSALALQASAQSSGFYEKIFYREDDPFVFCTKGQRTEAKCWIPTPPYLGGWMYNAPAYCDLPYTPYGKPWTQDDYASLIQYESVCPNANHSGQWKGSGDPERTPRIH
jgi:hypothetical protein